jgi:hypothetical protein
MYFSSWCCPNPVVVVVFFFSNHLWGVLVGHRCSQYYFSYDTCFAVFFFLMLYALVMLLRRPIPLPLGQSQSPTLNLDPHCEMIFEIEFWHGSASIAISIKPWAGISYRNSDWATGWVAEESGFDSREKEQVFKFSATCKLALRITQLFPRG